jgi:hypothetical protein
MSNPKGIRLVLAMPTWDDLRRAYENWSVAAQGSPHSGLTLGEMNEPGGWCLVAGKNRAEPMLVLF